MCLAIYKPPGLDIPKQNLKSGFESNSDGCGLCWAEDGKINVLKGMIKFEDFYAAYEAAKQHAMLIHFRKSTHGNKDENNCHPFLFNDGKLALIHNGVIPIKCSETGYSDTWHFVNKVLDPMVREHGVPIDDQALSWFIRVSIGSDKVAVMDSRGEVIIFNEDKGNWDDATGPEGRKGRVWYSNYSFRSYRNNNSTTYPNTGYQGGHTPTYQQSHLPGGNRHNVADDDDGQGEWDGYAYHRQRLNEGSNKPLEIADDKTRGPGKMTEYGWYDAEIETEIEDAKTRMGMEREAAILHVFNNA